MANTIIKVLIFLSSSMLILVVLYSSQMDNSLIKTSSTDNSLIKTSSTVNQKGGEFIIQHSGKKCVSIDSTDRLYLTSDCTTYFTLTNDKALQHVTSGKCVAPESDSDDARLKLQSDCNDQNVRFKQTNMFSTKHIWTGKCWHPFGGSGITGEGTHVVIFSGCDENRLIFKFAKGEKRTDVNITNDSDSSTIIQRARKNFTKDHVVILLWTQFHGGHWYLDYSNCSQQFTATHDRSRNDIDVYLLHSRDWNENDLPPRDNGIPWLLWSQEALFNRNIMPNFNAYTSYRLDSDVPIPQFLKPSLEKPLPFKEKQDVVFGMFSNCETVRTRYMHLLMNSSIPVHSYGKCHRNKIPEVGIYQGDYRSYKTKVMRKYKFGLAFQNCDCDYFIDEQLLTVWNAGVIPIFMGTDTLKDFLPENLKGSLIYAKDFPNPADLGRFLLELSHDEARYNKYLEWKVKGFGNMSKIIQEIWSHSSWCRIALAVASGKINTSKRVKMDSGCPPRQMNDWIRL